MNYERIINEILSRQFEEGYLDGVKWDWREVAAWILETTDREGKPDPFKGEITEEFENRVVAALIESIRWEGIAYNLANERFPRESEEDD